MTSVIWHVARTEARILWRAWSFRIFTILGLTALVFMNIGLFTSFGRTPYFFHAVSGSIPLINLKMLTVFQGMIACFLATDFLKRDRKYDTTEVVYMRSMTNAEYLIGKILGVLFIFGLLNLLVITFSIVIHIFATDTPFAWQAYLYYELLICLPTLVFITGISLTLMNLIRNQAIVFVVLLSICLVSLILVGQQQFQIFDVFAWYLPVLYSDFVGIVNLSDLILIRGAYLLTGIGLIFLGILFLDRLRQSKLANFAAGITALLSLLLALSFGYEYLQGKYQSREYRTYLKNISQEKANLPIPSIKQLDLEIQKYQGELEIVAKLQIINESDVDLDSLLFTLNPALKVNKVSNKNEILQFSQDEHLIWITPQNSFSNGQKMVLDITYQGTIDQHYCYLDISDERLEKRYDLALITLPKSYIYLTDDFLHLTPECGWYPLAGLNAGTAFPIAIKQDFPTTSLSVIVPEDQHVFSQGAVRIDTSGSNRHYHFSSLTPLPQLSLTIGNYQSYALEVDSIEYSLHVLPGHQYFEEHFDVITDSLPSLIRSLKADYEMQLGMSYPYQKLQLVEVPVSSYSYKRIWTLSQEMVQPQIVFIPEMGNICSAADFKRLKRRANRRQTRANQEESSEEIQTGYFNSFVKNDIIGTETHPWSTRTRFDLEPDFYIFPNYVSYSINIYSKRWPIFKRALESYIYSRAVGPQSSPWRTWRGLTDTEKANLALKHISLEEIVSKESESELLEAAIEIKGKFLFALMESTIDKVNFQNNLIGYFNKNRYQNIDAEELVKSVFSNSEKDFVSYLDSWYGDTTLPGYIVENIESYKIIDNERTKAQVKFTITNPTEVQGLVNIGFRFRQQRMNFGSRWRRGSEKYDYEQYILIPAQSTKEVGIILDSPPSQMTVETFNSLNIPSTFSHKFEEQKLNRQAILFENEVLSEDDRSSEIESGVYIVDNEDVGFDIVRTPESNLLRRTLASAFDLEDEEDEYVGMRFWSPPGVWTPTTHSNFYGEFVHSAYYKRFDDGMQAVAWKALLAEDGDYDIYYHVPDIQELSWFRRRHGKKHSKGKNTFMIYHEYGQEEITLQLGDVEQGWNLLGSYHLVQGENRVELLDKGERGLITADAMKWVKR